MLLLHLFHGLCSWAKASELGEFLLDGLEPFMPLAVSDLSLGFMAPTPSKPILIVQLFEVCNFAAETLNLFAQDF